MSNKGYNITTNFALPLLGWIRSAFEPYLINAYIKHEGVDHYLEDHLFVLVREVDEERYREFEAVVIGNKYHVTQYYVDDKEKFSMHVFRLSDTLIMDYKLFLQGKYSRMSDKAKNLIKLSSVKNGINWRVLDRSGDVRKLQEDKIGQELSDDDEVWSCIYDVNRIDKEIFKSEMLDELV